MSVVLCYPIGVLAVGVISFVVVRVMWLQLLDAINLAVAFSQLGLLGHEVVHRQMFPQQWGYELVGGQA
jgi:fatty acid desaturase